VLALNKILTMRPLCHGIAALSMIVLSPQAQSSPKAQRPERVTAAAAPAMAPVRAAYASAEAGCTTGRKRFWIDSGWVVRRVTSCR
jgi:hypothetical protein